MKHLILVSVLALTATFVHAVDVTVEITSIESDSGDIIVRLWGDPASYLEVPTYEVSAPAREGRMQLVFEGVEPGEYGLSALHDEDGNWSLTQRRFPPFPAEELGWANGERSRFGAPDLEDILVTISAAEPNRFELEMR